MTERTDCIMDTIAFWLLVAFVVAFLVAAALTWGVEIPAVMERTYSVWCGPACVTTVYERRESHLLSEWATPPPTPNVPFRPIGPATNVCVAWGTPTPHMPPLGMP